MKYQLLGLLILCCNTVLVLSVSDDKAVAQPQALASVATGMPSPAPVDRLKVAYKVPCPAAKATDQSKKAFSNRSPEDDAAYCARLYVAVRAVPAEVVSAAVRADDVAREALVAAIIASKRSGRHNSAEAREALDAHLNASSAARQALEKVVKDYMS